MCHATCSACFAELDLVSLGTLPRNALPAITNGPLVAIAKPVSRDVPGIPSPRDALIFSEVLDGRSWMPVFGFRLSASN